MKVSPSLYRYPDVGVSCDERDLSALQAIQFPKLIVEVLSPGTEAFDSGLKFKEYRSLPSLEEYRLISSTQIAVERYHHGEGRLWLYYPYQAGDVIALESIGLERPIDTLYENVRLDPAGGLQPTVSRCHCHFKQAPSLGWGLFIG